MNMEKKKGTNLVSEEEAMMVAYLKEQYLEHANEVSAAVHPRNSFYTRYGKRALDLVLSVPIFVVLLPLNLVFGVCTYIDVGKPIFYKQKRTGLNGKPFTMVKFRNMNENRDKDGNLLPASERVTKFGHFMRKFSFDELLNFWNVVKGEMSIIGPRPYPTFFAERMTERHKMRSAVRPGIECPKMISLPNEEERLYNVKLENDIWYVENVSFLNDVRMFFKLFEMTFSLKIRNKHAGSLSYLAGYDEDGYAISTRETKQYFLEKGINLKKERAQEDVLV